MSRRGHIVSVAIPSYDRPGSKERPAVVIPCDSNNRRLMSTLVAGITTNTSRVGKEPTPFLIDPTAPEGASSGLAPPSAVKWENLYTVAQARIRRTVGHLSSGGPVMPFLAECLFCQHRVQAPDHAVGMSVQCPKCANCFTLALVPRAPRSTGRAPPPAGAQPLPGSSANGISPAILGLLARRNDGQPIPD
jgi:mRNA-degrading endonuclease toxin of MazEF toxin-antitoxin module